MADPAAKLAREIADMRRKLDGLSRAGQMSRSTVTVGEEEVTVSEGIGRGALALQISEQVETDLAVARVALEAADAALAEAGVERDQKIADAEAAVVALNDYISTVLVPLANGKPNVRYETTPPGSTVAAQQSLWFQVDEDGNILGLWQQIGLIGNGVGNTWVPREIRDEVIANLSVGKLVAGSAAIDELVAQKIAAASGVFLELEVGQLVAGTAAIDELVASKIFAEAVVAKMVTATEFIGENAILTGAVTAGKIAAEAITADKIAANAVQAVNIEAEAITADKIAAGAITADRLDIGQVTDNLVPFPALDSMTPWVQEGRAPDTYLTVGVVDGYVQARAARNLNSKGWASADSVIVAAASNNRVPLLGPIALAQFDFRFPYGLSESGVKAAGVSMSLQVLDASGAVIDEVFPFGAPDEAFIVQTSAAPTSWETSDVYFPLPEYPAGSEGRVRLWLQNYDTGAWFGGTGAVAQFKDASLRTADKNTLITPDMTVSRRFYGESIYLAGDGAMKNLDLATVSAESGGFRSADGQHGVSIVGHVGGIWFSENGTSTGDTRIHIEDIREWKNVRRGVATITGDGSSVGSVNVVFSTPYGSPAYDSPPVVVPSSAVSAGGSALVSGVSNVTGSGFTLRLASASGSGFSSSYDIGWVAYPA